MLIDFQRSALEWCTKEGSKGIFSIESVLKTNDRTWALGSEVKACNVYSKNSIFKVPTYSFQALFSNEECRIYRTYKDNSTDDTHSTGEKVFKEHKLALIERIDMRTSSVHESTNCNVQCRIKSENQELQFPIKHVNKNKKGEFQIETGPVAYNIAGELVIAYISFNELNSFELLVTNNSLNKREQQIIKQQNCEINLYTLV